eukprot:1499587-Amphidinium_carterae.1
MGADTTVDVCTRLLGKPLQVGRRGDSVTAWMMHKTLQWRVCKTHLLHQIDRDARASYISPWFSRPKAERWTSPNPPEKVKDVFAPHISIQGEETICLHATADLVVQV